MLLDAMHHSVWLAPLIWVVLYISDYAMTLWGAKLYYAVGKDYYQIPSYELNSYFQRDIAGLR